MVGGEVLSINHFMREGRHPELTAGDQLIIVTPIYAGRIPKVVSTYLSSLPVPKGTRTYFIAACAESMGNAGKYAEKLCKSMGAEYAGVAEILMPQGYIAMFDTPKEAERDEILKKAVQKSEQVARAIAEGKSLTEGPGKWSAMSHILNPIFYAAVVNAKGFHVEGACTGCGTCVNVCPLNNIKLIDGTPAWGKNCTHCMACISHCPTSVIEYQKKTAGKTRYVCPAEKKVKGKESPCGTTE